jgi:uncharacterized membrane protein
LNLGLWLLFLVIGGVVQSVHWQGAWSSPRLATSAAGPIWIDGRWLAPVGNVPPGYAAVDFFPIFPWFGVVLLGVWLGNWFYIGKEPRFWAPEWGHLSPSLALELFGRNSLFMYLVHQPLLIAVLYVFGIARFGMPRVGIHRVGKYACRAQSNFAWQILGK